jgi:hypothetical protein
VKDCPDANDEQKKELLRKWKEWKAENVTWTASE